MEIYKAKVRRDDADVPSIMHVIEYGGSLWLVPDWIYTPDGKTMRPERIIRLAQFEHSRAEGADHDFVVHGPIPKAALADPFRSEEAEPVQVVYAPNIPIPRARVKY